MYNFSNLEETHPQTHAVRCASALWEELVKVVRKILSTSAFRASLSALVRVLSN